MTVATSISGNDKGLSAPSASWESWASAMFITGAWGKTKMQAVGHVAGEYLNACPAERERKLSA